MFYLQINVITVLRYPLIYGQNKRITMILMSLKLVNKLITMISMLNNTFDLYIINSYSLLIGHINKTYMLKGAFYNYESSKHCKKGVYFQGYWSDFYKLFFPKHRKCKSWK